MQSSDYTEQDVRAFIEQAVKAHWNSEPTKGTAMLLSVLGGLVKERYPNFQSVIGGGLKAYLSSADIAQPVTYPGIVEKTGLVPNGVQLPSDLRQLFPRKNVSNTSAIKPIYEQDFWNAFYRNIEKHRYARLSLGNKVEILDVETPQLGDDLFEITKDDLVVLPSESTIEAKADATRAKIDGWLSRYQLSPAAFLRKESLNPEVHRTSSKFRALDRAFGHLSPQDQARIMIPLDIVLKLA